ncbi:MAG: 5-(carboxyamino)imidazole ribonucleotide synthase [Alphaproteobacteria bacterium]
MKDTTQSVVLGILGGGQLGRMSAMAAARLGISVIIYCPEENSPASQVALHTITAAYDDKSALQIFSDKCDFISYEFENIPVETIDYLEQLKPDTLYPKRGLLDVSQDRIKEKKFLNDNDIETTRWAEISSLDDIIRITQDWNCDGFILKTARFGYDGKGQIKCDTKSLENNSALSSFLNDTKGQALIMEDLVDFECEVSVVIARDKHEKTMSYGPMLNEHKNHILHTTTVPCGISKELEEQTLNIAQSVSNCVALRGVLTVEYFICTDGRVLVNEIAPRTHNSGHWSIDACSVSQFENHIRTVCALPVGSSDNHSNAVMLNLIGDDIRLIQEHYDTVSACVHDYGKNEVREGRKMGHITFLKPNITE